LTLAIYMLFAYLGIKYSSKKGGRS